MKPSSSKQKQLVIESQKKLSQFTKHQRNQKIIDLLGYSLLGLIFILFVMIVSGSHFDPFLSKLGMQGISHQKKGVYVDCSLSKNKNSRYCQGAEKSAERDWRRVTNPGGAIFSLNDK